MNSYWALIRDGWYWARDRKLVVILPFALVLLLVIFIVFVRIIPDPEGLKSRFGFDEITSEGHYYVCRFGQTFNDTDSALYHVKNMVMRHVPRRGMSMRTQESVDRDSGKIIELVFDDRKWVIKKDTIEARLEEMLGLLFDEVNYVRFDSETITLAYEVRKHVKTLPVRLTVLFSDKTYPIPFSASLFALYIERAIISVVIGFVGVIMALSMTQRYMSSSLERGTVELWLSKPISRTGFMLSRFVGGNLSIMIISLLLVIPFGVGLWFQTGVYTPGFLLVVPIFMFYFSCLYCVVLLTSIFLRRGSIYIALLLWVMCKIVYSIRAAAENDPSSVSPSVKAFADTGYSILPKLPEVGEYSIKSLGMGSNIVESDMNMFLGPQLAELNSLAFVFGTSLIFIAVVLAIASWIFSRKSY